MTAVLAGCIGGPPPPPPPPPEPPDRPVPLDQSFPGPACLDDPGVTNRVACENSAGGNAASEWQISGTGAPSIQGFATSISVNRGETVRFKVDTDARLYHLEIYRLGFYGGAGARKVATKRPSVALPQNQPSCGFTSGVNLVDCGNWAESAQWAVPANVASGIYFAKLVRDSGELGSSHVFFIVRDDASSSDILYQTSDTTWQAYNNYGGFSFYEGGGGGGPGAPKISYNRPFVTRDYEIESWVFGAEYPMVRWLESNGYDVSYFTGLDTDVRGNLLPQHDVFMSSGHDEYWSGTQRANVEAALGNGVNLAFFTANGMYWKTRWENSGRTLVSYKETTEKLDPSPQWTGLWRDPRFSPPADGGRPENELIGTLYAQNSDLAISVPAADGKMRVWRNTTIAQQSPGQVATLPNFTLGYEWDEAIDTGGGGLFEDVYGIAPTDAKFRPAGLVHLSTTTAPTVGPLEEGADPPPQEPAPDVGATASGPPTHHMTLYRAPSGALVFSSGTVQWAWGLDANHDGAATPTDNRMRQATVNLLADMGAQPATLQPGLVAATQSTDTAPPVSAINPVALARVNQPVTITGTALDSGGGVVGGVDISTDGGQTWNPATGREQWSFTWTPPATGPATIRTRAADDSANLESPGPGLVVVVAP